MFYSLETPRDENILPCTNLTRKYPMVNFFRTTVVAVPLQAKWTRRYRASLVFLDLFLQCALCLLMTLTTAVKIQSYGVKSNLWMLIVNNSLEENTHANTCIRNNLVDKNIVQCVSGIKQSSYCNKSYETSKQLEMTKVHTTITHTFYNKTHFKAFCTWFN